MPGNVLKEKLAEYDIPLSGAKKWVAAAIIDRAGGDPGGEYAASPQGEDLIPISVMQVVEEKLKLLPFFRIHSPGPPGLSWPLLLPLTRITARQD